MAPKVNVLPHHDEPVEGRLALLEIAMNVGITELKAGTAILHEAVEDVEKLRAELRTLQNERDSFYTNTARQLADAALRNQPGVERILIPNPSISGELNAPFMAWSTCCTADLLAPECQQICDELVHPVCLQRKLWEWVFIIHHLRRLNAIGPGKRGIVFGVGNERLPSLFAMSGAEITATDAPEEIGIGLGWTERNQYATKLEDIRHASIIDEATFAQRVRYATCDMNNIAPEFTDYDFCWSSCCFEHLGSLQAGLDFVVNSVEKTLKIGGIACHTTEFNLSSNDATVESGGTVIYRKRDMEALVRHLRERGHEVDEFRVAPDAHPVDFYVDLPPYTSELHLRLRLMEHTCTSAGLVIRRGR